jgi:hypothetical protein
MIIHIAFEDALKLRQYLESVAVGDEPAKELIPSVTGFCECLANSLFVNSEKVVN